MLGRFPQMYPKYYKSKGGNDNATFWSMYLNSNAGFVSLFKSPSAVVLVPILLCCSRLDMAPPPFASGTNFSLVLNAFSVFRCLTATSTGSRDQDGYNFVEAVGRRGESFRRMTRCQEPKRPPSIRVSCFLIIYSSMAERPAVYALIDYEDVYVQPLILKALERSVEASSFKYISDISDWPSLGAPLLQWLQYENIDFELALRHTNHLVNSYVIRKALIRKHYLSNTIAHWVAKNPDSILKQHWRTGVEFELDYAEFLDDALVEAFELRESFEKNKGKEPSEREWWILKAGMSDRGHGIRLFSTFEELEAVFEEWEQDEPSDEEGGVVDDAHNHEAKRSDNGRNSSTTGGEPEDGYGIMTSQLRHFVAQPYIHPPLLLPSSGKRKFHVRVYVLAVGALSIYVYKPALALFASQPYKAPWESQELRSHLTNTCLQGSNVREGSVKGFWDLEDLSQKQKEEIFTQICKVTGEVFEAAARVSPTNFQPFPNAFEIFGLDFLVDMECTAWLLEVNSFPDFGQTGDSLKGIIEGLFGEVANIAIKPIFELSKDVEHREKMEKVLGLDLGRR